MKIFHFKIAIKNAAKNGLITFARIFGLTLAFTVILLAVSYVWYETSFDKGIPDNGRIYRCLMQGQFDKEKADYAVTSPAQGEVIVSEIPEIIESLRVFYQGRVTVAQNANEYFKGTLYYADPNFFSFWGISLETDINDPLASDNNLVISQSLAKKQFGSVSDALGKKVSLRKEECIVTGVFSDLPKNFHLQTDIIQPLKKMKPDEIGWSSQSINTYIKTSTSDIDIDDLNFKITKSVYTHNHEGIDAVKAQTLDDLKYTDNSYLFYPVESLTDIHFSKHKFDPAITANKVYVYGAIVLAILVLLISSINFVNLTNANLSTRNKEVGIRKMLGALKKHIRLQFVSETLLFLTFSYILAVLIFLISGNQLAENLGFDVVLTQNVILKIIGLNFVFLLAFLMLVNVLPISVISNIKLSNLLKGEDVTKKRPWGNNGFLLAQFFLSVIIIICSIIVYKQIDYMLTKDSGYNSDNILSLNIWSLSEEQRKSFIEELESYPEIQSITTSSILFGRDIGMNGAWFGLKEDGNYFHPSVFPVSDGFFKTFNLKLKEGRFFEKNRETDFDAIVLNETAFAEFEGEGSIIDKFVWIGDDKFKVIGIVKDFNFRSLHHELEPLVIQNTTPKGFVYVKAGMNQAQQVIGVLKKLWNEYNINLPFDYSFQNEILARHYNKDQQIKKLLIILSAIAIAIACIGLYAVSSLAITKKTKEIAIRKVNGAKVSEILILLNTNFIKWVSIAFIIAAPIAYYIMSNWLQSFAYKTELSWWIFMLAGIIALGIAILTVSWQSWRAARRNPVKSLRYE